jgi:hypothetical protein
MTRMVVYDDHLVRIDDLLLGKPGGRGCRLPTADCSSKPCCPGASDKNRCRARDLIDNLFARLKQLRRLPIRL